MKPTGKIEIKAGLENIIPSFRDVNFKSLEKLMCRVKLKLKEEPMSEFKSKLNYDKWLEWTKGASSWWVNEILRKAKNNSMPSGLLGKENTQSRFVKRLLEMVPDGEREVYCSRGWCTSHDRIPASKLAHRLKAGWQPPEEPKELVGWDYIATLGHGTILRRDDLECTIVVIRYALNNFNDSATVYYDNDLSLTEHACAPDNHVVIASAPLSPSNSTIIWQKEEEYLGKLQ